MLSTHNAVALRNTLMLSLRVGLKSLLQKRIAQFFADGLADLLSMCRAAGRGEGVGGGGT